MSLVVFGAAVGSAADVQTISTGKEVDLTAHLAPGKLTLIDFYADWCGPCKALAPHLDRLLKTHPDNLALRKIDITRSGTPVAAQYGIQAIPHLKLFDGGGNLVSEGNAGVVLRDLEARLGGSTGQSPLKGSGRTTAGSPLVPIFILGMVIAAIAFLLIRKPPGGTDSKIFPMTRPPHDPVGGIQGASWFVMLQGSLEGPFSKNDLEDMLHRKVLTLSSKVRRRGDKTWKALSDVVLGG